MPSPGGVYTRVRHSNEQFGSTIVTTEDQSQMRSMALAELLAEVPVLQITGDTAVNVGRIAVDSRGVQSGDLFVALKGQEFDGHQYIQEAVTNGAAAVVCQRLPTGEVAPCTMVLVEDTHRTLGLLAGAYFDHPSRQLRLIGVTGTDGKTTTTLLTAEILRAAGRKVGHCTTVDVDNGISRELNQVGYTTPQALDLQRLLREMVDAGIEVAAVEVSSHALATGRVEDCQFDVAVFTNLAPEHLDFHHTLEEYRAQKLRLFENLEQNRTKPWSTLGVINADDAAAPYFEKSCSHPLLYSIDHPAAVRAREISCTAQGSQFVLETPQGTVTVRTHLLGRFNVRNWLAAAGAALGCGASLKDVAKAGESVRPLPGRMEGIDGGQPFSVYVDFAHTPQGLTAALDTLREVHHGRTIAVFGHAGRRDTHHRRDLVEAAHTRCDLFILTMDDPYDEDPAAILEEMRSAALALGCREGQDFICVLDRKRAFEEAFLRAKSGDAVLLAGRGHERSIPLASDSLVFHDPTVARAVLSDMGKEISEKGGQA